MTHPDQARVINLYDTLLAFDSDYRIQPALAESVEPSEDATRWTVRLREGTTFHDGRPITADDVVATLARITDPDDPKGGASGLSALAGGGMRVLDARTVRLDLATPDASLRDQLAQYGNGVVPADYDPEAPVGSGPFRLVSFQAGQRSVFERHPGYWREGQPYLGELEVIDFPDDTARVNALLGDQVDAIDQLPSPLTEVVGADPALAVLQSRTGAWLPFTMRVDVAPFDDVRVRQALRLVVDRQQMVDQVLSGNGRVANDLYAPFDPAYASGIPQRERDVERARALLAEAGQEDLRVELVTSPVAAGLVEAAQVFAAQAADAGITVDVRQVDTGVFYGEQYLQWPFAQDFWFTRNFLPQASAGSLPDAPYNETHWADPEFVELVRRARATTEDAERAELVRAAQEVEHERGGYIVWGFNDQVDAYNVRLSGLEEDLSGIPLSGYRFRAVSFGDAGGVGQQDDEQDGAGGGA
ncbi:ABC transporter substrate-binding protein [Pseudokineococcus sp. 5B2Z-1]|uniref:ABC transporter substrate-binding protein n=1 Tax=Pseudokineococcus sp. 5B2Z-1 TaxID=3132744 RepID=UPI00309D3EBB